jgi:hypothetical protein
MKSSLHHLIPFLLLFCSYQLRRLDSIQFLRSQAHVIVGRRLETRLYTESESYVTTDGQPASLSWNKAPIRGLRLDPYYCLTVAGLLMLGALSDERTGLSFAIATGPRQRSNSRVRVPWDS